jgi:hypothetical protein
MAGFGREIWLAGLGAVAVMDAEGAELFERLVERGKQVDARVSEDHPAAPPVTPYSMLLSHRSLPRSPSTLKGLNHGNLP